MNYGDKIKNVRERIGITQVAIANMLGIDKSLYGRYEKELQSIPLKHLITICDYFEISLDYAFGFKENSKMTKINKKVDNVLVGKRLKEFRKKNNLRQIDLANALNTTQSVIADYERGRYLIATPFLYTICKNYKVSADYLLGRID